METQENDDLNESGSLELPSPTIEASPIASVSEPGSGTGQPPNWEQLKAKILEAIKKDEKPEVFESLLADVRNFMTELKRTG